MATPQSVAGINVSHGESAIIAPADEMAEAVVELLRDNTGRHRLSLAGRQLIESEYSWAQSAASYEYLYDEICRLR